MPCVCGNQRTRKCTNKYTGETLRTCSLFYHYARDEVPPMTASMARHKKQMIKRAADAREAEIARLKAEARTHYVGEYKQLLELHPEICE